MRIGPSTKPLNRRAAQVGRAPTLKKMSIKKIGHDERFAAILRGRGWVPAEIVAAALGTTKRDVRALAEDSNGAVLGWHLGYKLTATATDDECRAAAARMRSQAARMNHRAAQIEAARREASL